MTTYREIHGRSIKAVSTDPTAEVTEGEIWYNTTSGTFKSALVNEAWSSGSNTINLTNSAGGSNLQEVSLLPFRAYQLIWHEYFRDQNVGDEYEQYTDSGIQADSNSRLTNQLTLRKSNWEKDYFTSALPFLQRGGEVTLPLGDTAPLISVEPLII